MSRILIENNNLYLLPLMVAIVIVIVMMFFSQRMKHEKLFSNETANFFHGLSYLKPFVWFINPDESDDKVMARQKMINQAGLHTKLNYRSFVSFQISLLLVGIFVYVVLSLSLGAWLSLIGFMFNIPIETNPQALQNTRILMGIGFLLAMFAPSTYLRVRANRNKFLFTQDLPLVQQQIIMLLRARRPVSDILFELARTNNRYQEIFETGYRIYLRDRSEGYEYLRNQFIGTGFEEAITILERMGEFSKDESLQVLENGLQQLIRFGNEKKKGRATFGTLVSQFSMMLPFGGVILLGAVPVIVYAFSMLGSGMSSGQ